MNQINIFNKYSKDITNKLKSLEYSVKDIESASYTGRIISATGVEVIASLPNAKVGDLCIIKDKNIGLENYAEVIAIHEHQVKLLPFGSIEQISSHAIVEKLATDLSIKVGEFLKGKILDGLGNIIDTIYQNDTTSNQEEYYPMMNTAPNALTRQIIKTPFYTKIKAIDLFITCGTGQRLAIFASPGMGKTVLMGMLAKYSEADIIVIGLIGERGREVREFIELELDDNSRRKLILIVATSDRPPVEQVKAAYTAHAIAEYFRDQGLNVLLFIDSITRFARAGREIGLAAGEPITRGGYPPSVFLSFPKLMERAGNNQLGSITAFYTVLMEEEQISQDHIASEVLSIVDGHIILSRKLVEAGHFPAINILTSLSRVADRIIGENHKTLARKARLLLSKYQEVEFLLTVGEYKKGNDQLGDEAIEKHTELMTFLQQDMNQSYDFEESLNELSKIINRPISRQIIEPPSIKSNAIPKKQFNFEDYFLENNKNNFNLYDEDE